MTPDERKRIASETLSRTMLKRWRDPSTRKQMMEIAKKANAALVRDESYSRAMSLAKRGEVRSPETRLKMSLAKKGRKHSGEHRRKNSEARKGIPTGPHSPERVWSQRFSLL